jgi:hypothetical protein
VSFAPDTAASLSQAIDAITALEAQLGTPAAFHRSFHGTAHAFQASLTSLALGAIMVIFLVGASVGGTADGVAVRLRTFRLCYTGQPQLSVCGMPVMQARSTVTAR